MPGAKLLLKTRAPPKCKFFCWLVLHDRCWTANRRFRHNLQDHDSCALCDQGSETIDHLLVSCSYSREVWFSLLRRGGLQLLVPCSNATSFVTWWSTSRKRLPRDKRKAFDTFVLLVIWTIWKERNARVFDRKASMPWVLSDIILDEGVVWATAGFFAKGFLFPSSQSRSQNGVNVISAV